MDVLLAILSFLLCMLCVLGICWARGRMVEILWRPFFEAYTDVLKDELKQKHERKECL